MSRNKVILVTVGVMLSLFMGSMEATVVATAMPTIATQLGGLELYSWVFSAYMLASTTTVPIYGKLSDVYGRRPVYAVAMVLFLIGSVLCAQSQSMAQLVTFRAIQGLGAGGLLPLAFIMIGDMFSFEQRARMQGLFSGVWGVSSIVGPLLGGFLVDSVSWQWVFYVNVLPGLGALALVWFAWREVHREPGEAMPRVDYAGAVLLSAGVVTLLLGLFQLGTTISGVLLALATLLLVALGWIERRVANPILPLPLFRNRLFSVACAHGVLAGAAVFGSASFVPLFMQAVLETTATVAGATLAPQLLGWVFASIVGGRLLLHLGYRTIALTGTITLTVGALLMTRIGVDISRFQLMVNLALMGIGMGLSIPALLIAVQSDVRRDELGTATSTVQFSRSMGGALGVSIMGLILSLRLASGLLAGGLDPSTISVDRLMDPVAETNVSDALAAVVRGSLADAMVWVFAFGFVASALSLAVTLLLPGGRIAQLGTPATPEQATRPVAAGVGDRE